MTMHTRDRAILATSILGALLAGCGSDDPAPYVTPDPLTCAVDRYEPGTLHAFPTRDQLVADASMPTGYRFALSLETYPEAMNFRAFRSVASTDLEDVDGASVNASTWSVEGRVQTASTAPASEADSPKACCRWLGTKAIAAKANTTAIVTMIQWRAASDAIKGAVNSRTPPPIHATVPVCQTRRSKVRSCGGSMMILPLPDANILVSPNVP